MMRCLYGNIEKPIEEFSDEHVIPQAIGGNIEPINPFNLTEICQRCNRLCGLFVDGSFVRSWFTQIILDGYLTFQTVAICSDLRT